MFRKITIVKLNGSDRHLDYQLAWPARTSGKIEALDDLALMRHAGVLTGSLAGLLQQRSTQKNVKTAMVPIHYDVNQKHFEIITDLSQTDIQGLSDLLKKEIGALEEKGIWYHQDQLVEKDFGEISIDGALPFAKKLQEIEMLLYSHPINQERKRFKKLVVSAMMLGHIHGVGKMRKTFSDSGFLSLLGAMPLHNWLSDPESGCYIVLGKETGDQDLYRVKQTAMQMLEVGGCDIVTIFQPGYYDVYSSSWFYDLYYKYQRYFRSKQAI